MAVQQNKKSKSKKGMRRAHHQVDIPNVVFCKCGEATLSHTACPACGVYRDRTVVQVKSTEAN
ncbi:50S ribosomal protein L32 [Desulfovibrio litoralis]|uniref:Large ribosomal subunit protein bL32 n=1 Tax=Desulfovibrio litoralis DSM 11393 TaxID=1121455 RepID=A0A1M7SDI8_9BACT|nr:50S ribosomal protein L32 [Desulfovibrio litoralis]SHN56302.1 LSU ribosomal protein L32P [Desulfovibrio litoralis DSM 11393]